MSGITVSILLLVSYPLTYGLARPGPSGTVGLLLGYVIVGAVTAMLSTTMVQHLIGAAVIALGSADDESMPPRARWWTLRWRLVIPIATLSALAGLVTSTAVLGTAAERRTTW